MVPCHTDTRTLGLQFLPALQYIGPSKESELSPLLAVGLSIIRDNDHVGPSPALSPGPGTRTGRCVGGWFYYTERALFSLLLCRGTRCGEYLYTSSGWCSCFEPPRSYAKGSKQRRYQLTMSKVMVVVRLTLRNNGRFGSTRQSTTSMPVRGYEYGKHTSCISPLRS